MAVIPDYTNLYEKPPILEDLKKLGWRLATGLGVGGAALLYPFSQGAYYLTGNKFYRDYYGNLLPQNLQAFKEAWGITPPTFENNSKSNQAIPTSPKTSSGNTATGSTIFPWNKYQSNQEQANKAISNMVSPQAQPVSQPTETVTKTNKQVIPEYNPERVRQKVARGEILTNADLPPSPQAIPDTTETTINRILTAINTYEQALQDPNITGARGRVYGSILQALYGQLMPLVLQQAMQSDLYNDPDVAKFRQRLGGGQ